MLKQTASIDDTASPGAAHGQMAIPFWGQTATHSFLGIYQGTEKGLVIHRINIVNKKTGKVDQIIDPQSDGCEFGFFTTSIYQNVENDTDPRGIWLNCYSSGHGDVTIIYRLDPVTQRYRVPENHHG